MSVSSSQSFESRRFDILRELGAGGMGVVYEALDRERSTRVALKRLRMLEPERLLLFKNEFRALQEIRHPNLVSLGELLEEDGQWFFTMELVQGVDFFSWVRPDSQSAAVARIDEDSTQLVTPRPLPLVDLPAGATAPSPVGTVALGRLRETLRQVAEGVGALHSGGKVHRDLKPSNILCTEEGRAVVLDFGLVADVDARNDARVMGTVPFMAPEQVGQEPTGPAADWYAFGVLIYLALTGRVPFSGPSEQVLAAKLKMDPIAPRALDACHSLTRTPCGSTVCLRA